MNKSLALLALSALALSTPAVAREAWEKWEIGYQTLNAVDTVQTCDFLRRGTAHELNPILGRHPKCIEVVGFKIAGGALHYLLVREVAKHDANVAKWIAITSVVVQGGVVTANLRFAF